jgi:hypothetical protein
VTRELFSSSEFCNSACVVPIGKALHVCNIDGITVKGSTVLVKSLCSIKEGTVDRDSTIFVPDI